MFSEAGSVKKVFFQEKPSSGEKEKHDKSFFKTNVVKVSESFLEYELIKCN